MGKAPLSDDRAMTTVIEPVATQEPASETSSLAASGKFRTFAVTFAVASPILYFACLFWNLPLLTYHPAMNRIDFGWTPARSGEGPAMYWYGWTLTVLVAGAMVSLLATLVPERAARKIPLYLVWLVPLVAIPLLAYSLREFWSHP
jgi:hypothetical protein